MFFNTIHQGGNEYKSSHDAENNKNYKDRIPTIIFIWFANEKD